MAGAGDDEFTVSSWGWRQVRPGGVFRDDYHRIWRCRWVERPGEYVHVTGPDDAGDALVKFYVLCRDGHADRLPWEEVYD